MDITLNENQYENLIKLVFLGDWLINSFRTERIKDFEELESLVYSFAQDSELEKFVSFDEATREYFPSDSLEEAVVDYIEEYDEDNFWDELVRSLGQRDFVRHFGRAAIQKMKFEEMLEKERPFVEKYVAEFEKSGLRNLILAEAD